MVTYSNSSIDQAESTGGFQVNGYMTEDQFEQLFELFKIFGGAGIVAETARLTHVWYDIRDWSEEKLVRVIDCITDSK